MLSNDSSPDPRSRVLIVSGAGNEKVNGTYVEDGNENGKPRFVQCHSANKQGEYKIVYNLSEGDCPPFWVIVYNHDDEDFLGLYHTESNVCTNGQLPPAVGWVNYHDAAPPPTIELQVLR